MIWTVAPDAYQNGPDTPSVKRQYLLYGLPSLDSHVQLYATEVDWRRVAAHVQEETTAADTRPDLTLLIVSGCLKLVSTHGGMARDQAQHLVGGSSELYLRSTRGTKHLTRLQFSVVPLKHEGSNDHTKGKEEAKANDNAIAHRLAQRRLEGARRRHADCQEDSINKEVNGVEVENLVIDKEARLTYTYSPRSCITTEYRYCAVLGTIS